MADIQSAKRLVAAYYDEVEKGGRRDPASIMGRYVTPDYWFRGVHPFNELHGAEAVAATVWSPMLAAFAPIQRRQDVFMAGVSETDGQIWVSSMGHLMGLFDKPWLGIPPTGKMVFLRYAEFHRISGDRIAETGFFCDIPGVMRQAGLNPLPLETGVEIIVPGPRTHDGLLFEPQDPEERARSLWLINEMRQDLYRFRDSPRPLEVLARTWHHDMLWFGPTGIGSTYTIPRYEDQHQGPFRATLSDIKPLGQVCRFAEGLYAAGSGSPVSASPPWAGSSD